jgi:hypothetical protein
VFRMVNVVEYSYSQEKSALNGNILRNVSKSCSFRLMRCVDRISQVSLFLQRFFFVNIPLTFEGR